MIHFIDLVYPHLKSFRAKVRVHFENSKFIIKTADNDVELKSALKLRYDVFYGEMAHKKKLIKIDLDKFDFQCDHLIIYDKSNGMMVGTYRLNSSLFSKRFYSSTEFKINNILALPDVKLELGRACVHKDYRKSNVITILWRGIHGYMQQTNARYTFGASSVKDVSVEQVAQTYRYFLSKCFASSDLVVKPKKSGAIPNFNSLIMFAEPDDQFVPPLLKFYIRAGAVICGMPVYDKKFNCYDFFTLLDISKMNGKIEKKIGD